MPVRPVVGEEVPELGKDGHGCEKLSLRSEARFLVDLKNGAEVVPRFVRAQVL